MPRKNHASDDGLISRRRTADMLRKLRDITRDVRMLKADIDAAAKGDAGVQAERLAPRSKPSK